VKGMEHENIVNEIILRTQAQAEYTHENYGHFGLNLRRYAHFTSPIRRYADLIVHRALIRALKFGEGALPDMPVGELAEIAARISAAERRAMAAERETVDRLIAHHLADKIGARFQARISGVTKSGLFVRLLETGADGFVPAATLGREYYAYDPAAHALTSRSGVSYRLADVIEVRLIEAAPIAGALRFEITSGGERRSPPRNSAKKERERKPARRKR
jgi:ribonuclease R